MTMRPIITLSLSTLLACGPLAPPVEAASTSSSTTGETTETPPPPPTSAAPMDPATTANPTTGPTPTTPTTTDLTTTSPPCTGADSFLAAPDGGCGGGSIDCDPFVQDCSSGQKCVPVAINGDNTWNALKCVDIIGDAAPGEPCTAQGSGFSGIDDCALGAYCWDVDDDLHGTCVAQCTGSLEAPLCAPKSICFINGDAILTLCLPTCHPLLADCAADEVCIPNQDTFVCAVDFSGDEGQANDPCETFNACDPGLVCLDSASASAACQRASPGCCQPFCELPDAPCPNPDQQCVPWFDPMMQIPEGLENLGVCFIPS